MRRAWTWIAPLLLLPARAEAHLVSTELGPFYDGAAHPLATPEDLLVVLALAALAAFRGAEGGRRALLGLCLAWTAAAWTAFAFGQDLALPPWSSAALLVLLGLASALRLAPSPRLLLALGLALGALHGAENGAAARAADAPRLGVLGIVVGVSVLATLAMAGGVALERRQASVALRVAGSWIAAVGVMLVGWQLRELAG